MTDQISPEPTAEERRAIGVALGDLATATPDTQRESAWWNAGVRENVESER